MVTAAPSFVTGGERRAVELLDDVDRRPEAVEVDATRLASATDDDREASIAWRAAGIARRMLGRPSDALTALDASVAAAERAGDSRLAGLARTSRAAPRFMTGDMRGGLDDLQVALATLDGADRGVAVFQHAQYLDVVEDPGAGDAFDEAVALLADSPEHAKYLGHALANRGLNRGNAGRTDEATADLTAALAIWDDLGLGALAATSVHNLGVIEMLRGDFVAALDHFESAQQRSSTLGHEGAASGRDYCDALLAVGLARDAFERAVELADACDAAGDSLAGAELRLLAAHAALQLDDVERTAEMATLALRAFDDAGRPGWSAQSRLALARAAVAQGDADAVAIDALAAELHAHAWRDAALNAALLAADVALRAGDVADAERRLDAASGDLRSARAERRLQAHTVAAAVAAARSDASAARRAVRRGLTVVEDEQRAVGAIDARAHFASHAARLVAIGREQAIRQRDLRASWHALERMRALSLRHPRVRPVDDEALAGLLADLRQVSVELSVAEPGSPGWDALSREHRRLQRRVADHVRRTPGATGLAGDVDLDDIAQHLDGGAMIAFEPVGGRLWSYTFDGRMRRRDLGELAAFTDRIAAVQAGVRRLARRTLNPHSAALAARQLTELAAWLDAHLPLGGAGQPLVLVIPAEMAAMPWGALASLAGRRVTLAPSAWSWAAATATAAPPTSDGAALFVAGPGLPAAATEVRSAAAAHGRAVVLDAALATSAAAGAGVERAATAHVAAHYSPRRGNPLFSAFELADGPWFLHDLTRCDPLPATWVVPSCESAVGDAPVAGELLGLTSVLLGAGARSVVLSSGLVPDDEATVAAMTALHRALAAGTGPAAALAEVLRDAGESPAAVVLRATLACHGAW